MLYLLTCMLVYDMCSTYIKSLIQPFIDYVVLFYHCHQRNMILKVPSFKGFH